MRTRGKGGAFRLLVLLLIVGAISVVAAQAKGYMTVPFRYRKARPAKIVLLPPHAEFVKNKVIMTEEMVQESEALEVEAANALAAQLKEKGYRVRTLTPMEIRRTPGLQALVKRVNDRYNEEWSKIVRSPRQVKKHRYRVGPDAVKLCALFKADGLAIARVQAIGVSAGKAILSGIGNLGVPSHRSYARLDLSIVGGRDGKVEAYFTDYESTSLKQLTRKPARIMSQVTANTLGRYPGAAEFEQEPTGAESAEEEEAEDRGDPIAEFEALLAPRSEAKK